ncbi:hypothetical protein [Pantoea sp. MHSD4]|jgi:hypothetical protein|uniref:hypothetical protein n=1 Tax=Pantoea sp. ANP04 TaxID=3064896 RepID=UPI0002A6C0EA|nr:Rhs-family protein [Pantoea agglomerans 299R]
MHNRVTELNGIRWQYDIHGRTPEKDDGHIRWPYRYDGEHRLKNVISEPRDRNKPRTKVIFRYDPLGHRINKKPVSRCYRGDRRPMPSRRALYGKATVCCRRSTTILLRESSQRMPVVQLNLWMQG